MWHVSTCISAQRLLAELAGCNYTKLNNVHDRSWVGAIGQAVRGERGFMTKQLNVVDHKIKLFKAPLPPPRRRKTQGNAHQEIALTESSVEF